MDTSQLHLFHQKQTLISYLIVFSTETQQAVAESYSKIMKGLAQEISQEVVSIRSGRELQREMVEKVVGGGRQVGGSAVYDYLNMVYLKLGDR